jgi:hypothetical protein
LAAILWWLRPACRTTESACHREDYQLSVKLGNLFAQLELRKMVLGARDITFKCCNFWHQRLPRSPVIVAKVSDHKRRGVSRQYCPKGQVGVICSSTRPAPTLQSNQSSLR